MTDARGLLRQDKRRGSFRRPADIILRRVNDVPGSTEAQRRWHIERIEWKTGRLEAVQHLLELLFVVGRDRRAGDVGRLRGIVAGVGGLRRPFRDIIGEPQDSGRPDAARTTGS